MEDQDKTKAQLQSELADMRQNMRQMSQRLAELEASERQRQQTAEALTRLLELSRVMVSTRDVKVAFDQAIKSAVEIATAADTGSLQLLDGAGQILRTVAVSGAGDELLEVIPFQPGVGIAGHALASGQTINVPDVLADERFISGKLPLRFRSLLVAPLIVKGRPLGTLSLSSKQANAFSPANEILIKLIADQTAVALENARLFTDLRTSEEATRRAERWLRAFIENVEDMVYFRELDGSLMQLEAVNVKISGYTPADFKANRELWREIIHPDDLTRLENFLAAYPDGTPGFQVEYRLLTRNGEWRWIQSRMVGAKDDSGNYIGYYCIDRDISERKRAEEELERHRHHLEELVAERTAELTETNRQLQQEIADRRRAEVALAESEKRYRAIVEDQTELISRFLPDGTLTFVNQAYCRYFGQLSQELVGHNFLPLLPPEDQTLVKEQLASLSQEKPVETYEHQVLKADGGVGWHRRTDRAIFDQHGRLVEFQSVGRDVTEHKLLEEQLRQAQKMEAIGRLAGGVAHDFNNLLTVIMGHGDLLLHNLAGDHPLRQEITEIKKASERAASLAHQLLAFGRKQVLRPRILDLNAILADMSEMLQRLVGEDINLVTMPGENLSLVQADPSQIEQVALNLAANARDAMPHGGQLIIKTANSVLDEAYARQHVDVKAGSYVMIAVSDTGQGMDKQTQAHIFEPFFTTKELGKGTGLGLATVYGIVKQSDGHIDVESQPGRGTTFKIYLPPVTGSPKAQNKRVAEPAVLPGSETILVVEDELMVRQLVREMLILNGYAVLEAGHADAALQICDQHEGPIHLLLTDVIMPGMNGPQLAEEMLKCLPNLKVLYMSGYTNDALIRRGVLQSDIDFLPKPFTPDILTRKVREVLDN